MRAARSTAEASTRPAMSMARFKVCRTSSHSRDSAFTAHLSQELLGLQQGWITLHLKIGGRGQNFFVRRDPGALESASVGREPRNFAHFQDSSTFDLSRVGDSERASAGGASRDRGALRILPATGEHCGRTGRAGADENHYTTRVTRMAGTGE